MDLESRVARLERTNRRLVFGLAAAMLLCVGMGAAGAIRDESGTDVRFATVRAMKFVVEDENFNTHGLLGFYGENEESLQNVLILKGKDNSGFSARAGGEFIHVTKADGTKVRIP